jgi:hypothetical protein
MQCKPENQNVKTTRKVLTHSIMLLGDEFEG